MREGALASAALEAPGAAPALQGIADAGSLKAAGFTDVGASTDVPLLEGRRATVDGRRVAVFRMPSGFAATDAACPHKGGPLSDGLVADGCVTCPLHNWRMDLTTGAVAGQDVTMPIHDVVVLDGRLWVRIAADAGEPTQPAPPVTVGAIAGVRAAASTGPEVGTMTADGDPATSGDAAAA
jgi:nitrite reductase (NADH) small subunit